MNKKSCVFIFRRDIRIKDNTTFLDIIKKFDIIYPVFFLVEEQVGSENNYKSADTVSFMKEIISQFQVPIIKIKSYKDIPKTILKKYNDVSCVAFNKDYSPYSLKRDSYITTELKKYGVSVISEHDQLLMKDFFLRGKIPFSKFTFYYNKVKNTKIKPKELTDELKREIYRKLDSPLLFEYPVRKNILSKFKNSKVIENYTKNRETLKEDTTRLSVYLKFGVVSPREAYTLFKDTEMLSRQLFWRDFYYTYYFFNGIEPEFDIHWEKNKELLEKWKKGETGYPIVDASMRQLNQTGFMHNRGRMIVSSFLSKNLHIDWREGEKYFSKNLLDIDWIQNLAGWQSTVGVSKHSLPYFRVFNPFRQSKVHDPECEYIKKWVPELKDIPPVHIHNWEEYYSFYDNIYHKPCVDFEKTKKKFIEYVKNCKVVKKPNFVIKTKSGIMNIQLV